MRLLQLNAATRATDLRLHHQIGSSNCVAIGPVSGACALTINGAYVSASIAGKHTTLRLSITTEE